VKSHNGTNWAVGLAVASLLAAFPAATNAAARKDDKKDKPKPTSAQMVDSGSFGVFVKGQRVVTETFSVHQQNGISIIKSQLKQTAGPTPPVRSQPSKSPPAENCCVTNGARIPVAL